MEYKNLAKETLDLLKQLIAIPSVSKDEDKVSDFFFDYMEERGLTPFRKGNNLWLRNKHFSAKLPTILLNSHMDTIKPSEGWTIDPFTPLIKDGKLYGLGSNDAGLSLSSLFAVFQFFNHKKYLDFNLIFSATAEEEISGANGIQSILPDIADVDFGIIGEPTAMRMAIAEKGLIVLDCYSSGKPSHTAHYEQNNAIVNCLDDLYWFKNYRFKKKSALLGETKASVCQINAGTQHNVIPDKCHFVVDIRVNDKYTNQEVVDLVNDSVTSEVVPRSLRLKPSVIALDHPIVKKGNALGLNIFGSRTLSDQALIEFPSIKMGPGDSVRSHTADEYIKIDEIEPGIKTYINLLDGLKLSKLKSA